MMQITDDVKEFKEFIKYCSLPKDGFLFEKIFTVFRSGKCIVYTADENNITSGKIVYRPNKTSNGEFWCEPAKLIKTKSGKINSMKDGDITINIDGNIIKGKCGPRSFGYTNISLDDDDKESFKEAKNFAEKIKVTDSGIKTTLITVDFAFKLVIDVADMQSAIKDRDTLTNPSHYRLNVTKKGDVSIMVVDDEQQGDTKDYYDINIGKIAGYKGDDFYNIYRSCFTSVFHNLSGEATIFFGRGNLVEDTGKYSGTPIVIYKQIAAEGESLVEKNKFELMYIIAPGIEDDEVDYSDDYGAEMTDEDLAQEIEESEDEEVIDDDE